MNTREVETTIFDDEDNAIHIKAILIKGMKGMKDVYGLQETPDDEDEVEIIESINEKEEHVELTQEQLDKAISELN